MSNDGEQAITLIVMLGSVFSPAYARARRKDPRADPLRHCAMNVALYARSSSLWCLTERAMDGGSLSSDMLRIGESSAAFHGDRLVVEVRERTAPFGRTVHGTVTFAPTSLTGWEFALDADAAHRWRPLSPTGRIDVRFDDCGVVFSGRGYLDANDGDTGLECSFDGWAWSRAHLDDGSAVVSYDTVACDGSRRSTCLEVTSDGRTRERDALPMLAMPSTAWGIERRIRCDATPKPILVRTLENTPFYARTLARIGVDGRQATSVHETVSARRFDASWVRFLIPFRMRTAKTKVRGE